MTRLRDYPNKVACLEGDWEGWDGRSSVLRILEMIEVNRKGFRYSHRRLLTVEELTVNLGYIGRAPSYRLVYLAFHGTPGAVCVGEDKVSIEVLAEIMGKRFTGRVLHFGTCSTLRCAPERVEAFLESTGVAVVTGYERNVDWMESAAFELLYYYNWTEYVSPPAFKARMLKDYGELADRLGFACYFQHSRKCSER